MTDPSVATRVEAAAGALGIELTPWQEVVLRHVLEHKGPLHYPRQQGRGAITRAAIRYAEGVKPEPLMVCGVPVAVDPYLEPSVVRFARLRAR